MCSSLSILYMEKVFQFLHCIRNVQFSFNILLLIFFSNLRFSWAHFRCQIVAIAYAGEATNDLHALRTPSPTSGFPRLSK